MITLDVSPATVRYINKNHVTISPAKGFSVTLFNLVNGNVEAVVAADDGSETIRLLVAGPGPTQTMAIKSHKPTGIVDILYAEKLR